MSMTAAQARLQQSMKELVVHWEQTLDEWDDPVAKDFQRYYLEPLEPSVRSAMVGMTHMLELLHKARQECR